VASRIGGIPEFIKEGRNGLLADPKDSLEFAKKIIYMLKNEEETKIMGSKAREDIARICDEDRVLNELLQLYKSLLVRK
jgi:glycosyltransferase involved in cell wall biosynthesis